MLVVCLTSHTFCLRGSDGNLSRFDLLPHLFQTESGCAFDGNFASQIIACHESVL